MTQSSGLGHFSFRVQFGILLLHLASRFLAFLAFWLCSFLASWGFLGLLGAAWGCLGLLGASWGFLASWLLSFWLVWLLASWQHDLCVL